jgi:P-type Ca2+ transporter type 2C
MDASVTTPSSAIVWHTLDSTATATRLNVDPLRGLSATEVVERQARHGPNALHEGARRSPLRMLAAQFGDFMILLLIAAAVVSGFVGDIEDTVVILGIVVLNAVVGFVQEYRAERAMAALKRLAPHQAVVLRDGHPRSVRAETLVPGDVLLLEAGNAVPADLRLIDAVDFKLGEAALTGESLPVEKHTAAIDDPALSLGDRHNMAYRGTAVLYGRGRGIVVATGMATELGRIASLLEGSGTVSTPLQLRLAAFGRQIAVAAIAICVLVFIIGWLRSEPLLLMLLTALSLAVAAIPEALPAVITVLLALGAARMAREHALIRRLPAVETLGSVTTICTDKTGTLTRNEMQATQAMLGGAQGPLAALDPARPPARGLLHAMALCNDVVRSEDGRVLGDPTEVALWQGAADAGVAKPELERTAVRLRDVPFDSERKRMTTLHADGDGFVSYTKGAPETVLLCCDSMAAPDGAAAAIDREAVAQAAERMAEDGLRVLAFACRHWDALPAAGLEQGLTFLGLVGLIDPPRPEAQAAVATCRQAGINTVMITGDHPVTARAIARQLGLLDADGAVMTGRALQALSDDELQQRVGSIRVYARADPAQKIRIVAALQQAGEIVAMTGDGVNDAPALARADIGVAMGKVGTDVARESASLVLLDDNFATIVKAVREGRRIYDNIRKFVRFVVTCNSAEILTILLAPLVGLPMPLLPIQILWINLVTDGLPGLALATEPAERDVMQRPPRPPGEGLFARGMLRHVIWIGLLMAALTLLTEAFAVQAGLAHWQTMVFTVLTLVQLWQVMAIRSDHESLFRQGLLSNVPLLGAVTATFMLQLAVIYVPQLNVIFDTAPLTVGELLSCIGISSVVFIAIEISKWILRARLRSKTK